MTSFLQPDEIERESFRRIERALGRPDLPEPEWTILLRMIHATADLELAQLVAFHPQAVAAGLAALRRRAPVFTDTRMLLAGVSNRLTAMGIAASCLLDHPEVASLARQRGWTRSAAAVELAAPQLPGSIVAIGNAPTALRRLLALLADGLSAPALIIGLPVGFVDAAESKAALMALDVPYISLYGPKGGSPLAASALNALAILARKENYHEPY